MTSSRIGKRKLKKTASRASTSLVRAGAFHPMASVHRATSRGRAGRECIGVDVWSDELEVGRPEAGSGSPAGRAPPRRTGPTAGPPRGGSASGGYAGCPPPPTRDGRLPGVAATESRRVSRARSFEPPAMTRRGQRAPPGLIEIGCVVSTIVVPSSARLRMSCQKSRRAWWSKPVVGSSRKSSSGLPMMPRLTSTRSQAAERPVIRASAFYRGQRRITLVKVAGL